jgi:hypothetical protein
MYSMDYISPSSNKPISKDNSLYGTVGPLDHLNYKADDNNFTLQRVPEFLFAAPAAVGPAAMVLIHCLIYKSSIQKKTDYGWEMAKLPVIGKPEFVLLSNMLVQRYGMCRQTKYYTIKLLEKLDFIELYKQKDEEEKHKVKVSPIARISRGILQYKNITKSSRLWQELQLKAKAFRKEVRVR